MQATVAIKLNFPFHLHKTYIISITFLRSKYALFYEQNYYETEVTV